MIKRYQNLLNECIDIQEDYTRLNRMKTTLLEMKSNLLDLKIKKLETRIQLINSYIHNPNWK